MERLTVKQVSWLAGFWEGDGRFELLHGEPAITFVEDDNRDIHRYIYGTLGCGEYSDSFGLKLLGDDCLDFLRLVKGSLVSFKRTKKLNDYFLYKGYSPFAVLPPTLDWLVGFWDANGSSGSSKVYPCSISASCSDPHVVLALSKTLGGWYYTNGNIPVWKLRPTAVFKESLLRIATYLVENSRKEDRRLKLQERLNNYLAIQELRVS